MPEETYRRAASVLLLRPSSVCKPGGECEDIYHILLLHKPRKGDAWQLPQGGVEKGETIEQAALRELKEEAGITGSRVLGGSERVYQYDFSQSYRRFRPDNVRGQKIGYVFALAPENARVQVDEKEIDSYAWVDQTTLGQYIKRKEYLKLVEELLEEGIALAKARSQGSGRSS
jgi:putative (di)nucleoside polyphosphate hydrolase